MHVHLWILVILPLAGTLITFIIPGTPLPPLHTGEQGAMAGVVIFCFMTGVSWFAYRTAHSDFAASHGLFVVGPYSPPPPPAEPVTLLPDRAREPVLPGVEAEFQKSKLALNGLDLATKIFASVQEGIIITDASGAICSTNPAFRSMSGYADEELLGHNMRIMKSGRHSPEFYERLWHALHHHGQWQGNIWNRRKNGEVYPQWSTINCIRGEDGTIRYFVGILSDLTLVQESEEQLKFLAHFDPLTELPNRILFKDRLHQAMTQCRRTDQLLGVLWLGVDRFRQVNEAENRAVGDVVLKAIGARLKQALREGDTVARTGGDEFAILATNILEVQHLTHVAQKVLSALGQNIKVGDQSLRLTASIGITIFPMDETDTEGLLKHAETAMRQVKSRGGNGYQFFTRQMGEIAMRRWSIEQGLQTALDRQEFFLHYQPQFCVESGRIIGVEALVRWRSPQFGLVAPDQFVALAEENGLIVPLGEWILREACQQNVRWQEQGLAPIKMAVNISPRQFMHDNLEQVVAQALRDTGLDPRWLELEITEGLFLNDQKRVRSVLTKWRQQNLHISIDDFGTGYSSLSYLSNLPIHSLKIDRSFIRDVAKNPESATITRSILSLAKNLNLTVVAEGVANEEQMEFLRDLGCDKVQGYLFSPPIPAEDVTAFLTHARMGPLVQALTMAPYVECRPARERSQATQASMLLN
ncbi:MAG: EAL domain-containing protein [Magnetococcales bacterium]|nr:EAL domain-containing protein [Magnetococcales bacterium]